MTISGKKKTTTTNCFLFIIYYILPVPYSSMPNFSALPSTSDKSSLWGRVYLCIYPEKEYDSCLHV